MLKTISLVHHSSQVKPETNPAKARLVMTSSYCSSSSSSSDGGVTSARASTSANTDPCDTSYPATANSFQMKYFSDTSPDMSVSNVFRCILQYATAQWYFQSRDPDPSAVWDPQRYFLDFSALVQGGKAGKPLGSGMYLRQLIQGVLAAAAGNPDTNTHTMVKALETILGWPELDTIFPYPRIVGVNTDSVTLRLPYSIDKTCTTLLDTFTNTDHLNIYMRNFYKDTQGVYMDPSDGQTHYMEDPTCVSVPTPITYTDITLPSSIAQREQGMTTVGGTAAAADVVGQQVDIRVKMSFMMMLREYVENQCAFQCMDTESFEAIRVGKSVPYPACQANCSGCACAADNMAATVASACSSSGSSTDLGSCRCLYHCTFGAYECPGYAYYYNQLFDQCRCMVTRAVPMSTSLQDRINNKFGACFDINCADQPNRKQPDDCKDQCAVARQWLSDPNWAENFVNAAAVDVDLVEKTCGFRVPQFAFKSNSFFWTWRVVAGGVCMLLAVPLLVAMESWTKQKFSLRFVHILAFVFLVVLAVLFGYATTGVQVCGQIGVADQASCMDRLTRTIKMNHSDCDVPNPIFCQCDASKHVMEPCLDMGMPSCKCQSNQLCIPGDGEAGEMIQPKESNTRILKWQLLYFCMGMYFLVTSMVGMGLFYLTNTRTASVGWVPSLPLVANVALHLVVYLVLFVLMVVFPVAWKYMRTTDQTVQVNTDAQQTVCTIK